MLMIRGPHHESDASLLLFALPAYVNCNHRLEKEGGEREGGGRGRKEGEGGGREREEGGRGRREGERKGKGGEGGGKGRRGNYMIRDGRRSVYMHCMQYRQGSPMALHYVRTHCGRDALYAV